MVAVVTNSSQFLLFPDIWREIENIMTSGGGNFQLRATKPKTDEALSLPRLLLIIYTNSLDATWRIIRANARGLSVGFAYSTLIGKMLTRLYLMYASGECVWTETNRNIYFRTKWIVSIPRDCWGRIYFYAVRNG